MLFRIMLLGYFFISIIACGLNGSDRTDNTGLKNDTLKNNVSQNELPKDTTNHFNNNACDTTKIETTFSFRNDKFIADALGNELTCRYIDGKFINTGREVKVSQNKHSADLLDTVITYKGDCDTVAYFSANGNCFPLYLNIQSGRLAFNNGTVRVGMEKQEFVDRFRLKKVASDVIMVTETEAANEVIFVFKSNKLIRIVYNNLFVD